MGTNTLYLRFYSKLKKCFWEIFCCFAYLAIFNLSALADAPILKDKRVLLNDQQIALARLRIRIDPDARKLSESIIKQADKWVRWADDDMRNLITSAKLPRAIDVSSEGCPIHGKDIYRKGTYPWIIDPKRPFSIKCPIGGEIYPDNDFESYYKNGLTGSDNLRGKYSDNGWGWVSPGGQHFWFVAYANHWMWKSHIIPAVDSLAQAYVLTGNKRYAHKAIVMLDRIAEVYPDMDYCNQSRLGQLLKKKNEKYQGKILNHIWESQVLKQFAENYDVVWETIDNDVELQKLTNRTGLEIRTHIEENLLREGIKAYFEGNIGGNYGQHQLALVTAALVAQIKQDKWENEVFWRHTGSPFYMGLNYALYNLVYSDGFGIETSPAYNWEWVNSVTGIFDLFQKFNLGIPSKDRLKEFYDAPLEIINIQKYIPSLGDSGSVYGDLVDYDANVYLVAYNIFLDDKYAQYVRFAAQSAKKNFVRYEDLFASEIPRGVQSLDEKKSRLFPDYGLAILNNPKDTVSASLYFGSWGSHAHYDRLGFEIFAAGRPIIPDLGYPDAMNRYFSGIFTWSRNTVSHNTVVVDGKRQLSNRSGIIQLFADSPFARVVEIEASDTYPQCQQYRRCLVMVDVDEEQSYFIDIFTIKGGNRHDYSLHGPPGSFSIKGGQWQAQHAGTFAGKDVLKGQIYDDPVLGLPGYDGDYFAYRGSGFQHLFDILRYQGGNWIAQWSYEKDKSAGLRIRILGKDIGELSAAHAYASPLRNHPTIEYILATRQGQEPLSSTFVSIIEPFKANDFIKHAELIDLDKPNTVCIRVKLKNGQEDLITWNRDRKPIIIDQTDFKTDGHIVIVRNNNNTVKNVFAVSSNETKLGKITLQSKNRLCGKVVKLSPNDCEVRISLSDIDKSLKPDKLIGQIAFFQNGNRRSAFPVIKARLDGDDLIIRTKYSFLIGRAFVTQIEDSIITTDTHLMQLSRYQGTALANSDFTEFYPVQHVEKYRIELSRQSDTKENIVAGGDVWFSSICPGDEFEMLSVIAWP